jgi:DNA-binding NarL/FixJ family response regulator
MIVCVVDDLIFSIKISTAAKHLGVDLYFERAKDKVLQTIRDKQPSLVIFDLNSGKLAPIDAIAAMKADETLATIRTLGYVSHVDAETIDRARSAGIDQVLARSAFSERLGEILTSPDDPDQDSGGSS